MKNEELLQSENSNSKCKILLWIITVMVLSWGCYLPMLLVKMNRSINVILINLKYLFVFIPIIISLIFIMKEKNFKPWFLGLFSHKNYRKAVLICIAFIIVGICSTLGYSLCIAKSNLFVENYPNILSAVFGCLYLFTMAFIEETVWRGFLLDKISRNEKKIRNIFFSGVIWGFWHFPMWSIRNELAVKEIALYYIWSIFIAIILGSLFYKCHNILFCALLHTIFNVSYLSPILWNDIIMIIVLITVFAGSVKKVRMIANPK